MTTTRETSSVTLLRFLTVGIITSLIHLLIAFALIVILPKKFLDPKVLGLLSNIAAFVVASLFSYIVNTKWSFNKKLGQLNFIRFYTVAFCGLLATLIIFGATASFDLSSTIGTIIVVISLPPVNFTIHILWTYKKQTNT